MSVANTSLLAEQMNDIVIDFVAAVIKKSTEHVTCRQKKDEELLKFLVFFLDMHCIYVHKCQSHRFVNVSRSALLDMFSIRSNLI